MGLTNEALRTIQIDKSYKTLARAIISQALKDNATNFFSSRWFDDVCFLAEYNRFNSKMRDKYPLDDVITHPSKSIRFDWEDILSKTKLKGLQQTKKIKLSTFCKKYKIPLADLFIFAVSQGLVEMESVVMPYLKNGLKILKRDFYISIENAKVLENLLKENG